VEYKTSKGEDKGGAKRAKQGQSVFANKKVLLKNQQHMLARPAEGRGRQSVVSLRKIRTPNGDDGRARSGHSCGRLWRRAILG